METKDAMVDGWIKPSHTPRLIKWKVNQHTHTKQDKETANITRVQPLPESLDTMMYQ
jgi:hypothetical protein